MVSATFLASSRPSSCSFCSETSVISVRPETGFRAHPEPASAQATSGTTDAIERLVGTEPFLARHPTSQDALERTVLAHGGERRIGPLPEPRVLTAKRPGEPLVGDAGRHQLELRLVLRLEPQQHRAVVRHRIDAAVA